MAKVKVGSLHASGNIIGVSLGGDSEFEVEGLAEFKNNMFGLMVLSEEDRLIDLGDLLNCEDETIIKSFVGEFKTPDDLTDESVLDKIKKYGFTRTAELVTIVSALSLLMPN